MKPKWHWTNQPKEIQVKAREGMSKGWGRKPKTGKWITCPTCGKTVWKKLCFIKRSKNLFCSPECHAKFQKGKIPKNIEIAHATSPFQKGKENINWKGGISPYPKEWTGSLRRRVWVRDNNTCQICGKVGKKRSDLVCHHIDFDKKNCSFKNLQLLCRSCHMKVHWKADKGISGLKNYNDKTIRSG